MHRDIRTFSFAYVQYGCHAGFGILVRSVVQGLMGSMRAASTRSGYIDQAKHDYVTLMARKTTNWPSVGMKSLVAHV